MSYQELVKHLRIAAEQARREGRLDVAHNLRVAIVDLLAEAALAEAAERAKSSPNAAARETISAHFEAARKHSREATETLKGIVK